MFLIIYSDGATELRERLEGLSLDEVTSKAKATLKNESKAEEASSIAKGKQSSKLKAKQPLKQVQKVGKPIAKGSNDSKLKLLQNFKTLTKIKNLKALRIMNMNHNFDKGKF